MNTEAIIALDSWWDNQLERGLTVEQLTEILEEYARQCRHTLDTDK